MGSVVTDHSTDRYDSVAQLFHWLIAIMIFVVFGLGWYMTDLDPADPATFMLYQIHKGIGITILALAVLRLLWRVTHRPPPLPDEMKNWERFAASAAHIALYGLIFLQPIIGILQSNAANFPIVLFGQFELPALISQNKALDETLLGLHHLFAKVMALLVLAHIGAAPSSPHLAEGQCAAPDAAGRSDWRCRADFGVRVAGAAVHVDENRISPKLGIGATGSGRANGNRQSRQLSEYSPIHRSSDG